MALDDSGTRHRAQLPLRDRFRIGSQIVETGKVDVFVRINQVGNQESRPGIAGFRVGDQEHVVGKYIQITPRRLQTEGTLNTVNDSKPHKRNLYCLL